MRWIEEGLDYLGDGIWASGRVAIAAGGDVKEGVSGGGCIGKGGKGVDREVGYREHGAVR